MHVTINGRSNDYIPTTLKAKQGGELLLKDGTRYSFDVIEILYMAIAPPDINNNLIEIERLAHGKGKWMLGGEPLYEWLDGIQRTALSKLNIARSEHQFPRVEPVEFFSKMEKSPQLEFRAQSEQEEAIVRRINSEFFTPTYVRRWGLCELLQIYEHNETLKNEVVAAAWFEGEGNRTPVLLRNFSEIVSRQTMEAEAKARWAQEAQTELLSKAITKRDSLQPTENKPPEPLPPPDINETLLWHVEQKISDELDLRRKAVPSHSEVFRRFCRDRMPLIDMQKKFGWKYRTIKARKAALEHFLQTQFHFKLTLAAFFVDRRIFAAAEKQAKEYRATNISMRAVGECERDEEEN